MRLPLIRPVTARFARRTLIGTTTVRLFSVTHRRAVSTQELDAAKGDRERIIILGSGWAGYTLSRHLSPAKYQVLVVSPRSYFVFTPLLASTAVGTLEFRTALEPIRRRRSRVELYQGWADSVDFTRRVVRIEENIASDVTLKRTSLESSAPSVPPKGPRFDVGYDKLVIAVGCYSQTFGIKGVREHALFLKDVGDARRIRRRVLECFEKAALPTTAEQVKRQLLHFAVVGGGPTGIEFSAELHDLIRDDLSLLYPTLTPLVRITVYDVASTILSMFDSTLAKYATDNFQRSGIEIKTEHHVEELRPGVPGDGGEDGGTDGGGGQLGGGSAGTLVLRTREEGEVGVGMCVWSTGLMMNPFVRKTVQRTVQLPPSSFVENPPAAGGDPADLATWKLKKDPRTGGILTDDRLRVTLTSTSSSKTDATLRDVFALGDCASISTLPLPATAQVANQKALWLAKRLNKDDLATQAFAFKNLGVMAYIGDWKAVMQSGGEGEVKGRAAWVLWRTAYLTMSVSWRNRILIVTYWFVNWVFGRDISRF